VEPDETFTIPLPPPPDVLFVRHEAHAHAQPEREHEDIMLRKVPNDVARRFRAAAGGRALTHAQYLAALVELHESLRKRADDGDEAARADLDRLGLQSVTV
jgi:hypothetical protein